MNQDLETQAKLAKEASRKLALLTAEEKDDALKKIAEALLENKEEIFKANKIDLKNGEKNGMTTMLDRLRLTEKRLKAIADDVLNVVKLPDYVGKVIDEQVVESGLRVQRIRCPLGVIGLIYESRPNVTVDATALCLKSGNSVILRGGSDAINSNRALVSVMQNAIRETSVPEDVIQFIDSTEREVVNEMLTLREYIDVIIPRGGKDLINFVVKNSTVPVIETGASVVHTYVDKDIDLDMAVKVVINSKTRRVSVCNALDSLLVHKNISEKFLPVLAERLKEHSKSKDQPLVEIRADVRAHKILESDYHNLSFVNLDDYDTEFLDYIMSIKVVDSFDEALAHIYDHSLKHSEAIITSNKEVGERFAQEVDAACVFWNTSTAFADGAQFGIGAEIGISTQKMHARGPFALEGLTSYKWVVRGKGEVRDSF